MQTSQTTTTRPTSVDLATARILANIAERAQTLFSTGGYRAQAFYTNPAVFFVFPPQIEKLPYVVDTREGKRHCNCPAFAQHKECKHILACDAMIEDDRRADEAAEWHKFGRYDHEDNAE